MPTHASNLLALVNLVKVLKQCFVCFNLTILVLCILYELGNGHCSYAILAVPYYHIVYGIGLKTEANTEMTFMKGSA